MYPRCSWGIPRQLSEGYSGDNRSPRKILLGKLLPRRSRIRSKDRKLIHEEKQNSTCQTEDERKSVDILRQFLVTYSRNKYLMVATDYFSTWQKSWRSLIKKLQELQKYFSKISLHITEYLQNLIPIKYEISSQKLGNI